MNKKIIFSTGGTGGHILPAINLMNHFFDIGYEVVLVTDQRGTKFLNDNEKFKIYELKTDTPTDKVFLRNFLESEPSLFLRPNHLHECQSTFSAFWAF